jgi:uncharacterized protein YgiB involved in biofilm formation
MRRIFVPTARYNHGRAKLAKERYTMKKLILASVSALALFSVAACSDSGTGADTTTTQSTNPPAADPMTPAQPEATPPADNTMQPDATPTAPAN